jgi:hypothetical protein
MPKNVLCEVLRVPHMPHKTNVCNKIPNKHFLLIVNFRMLLLEKSNLKMPLNNNSQKLIIKHNKNNNN